MQYRRAELTDLDGVVEAWRALAADQLEVNSRVDPGASEPAIRDRFGQRIVDDGIIVADDGEAICGFVTFNRVEGRLSRTEAVGLIGYLWVDDGLRERGIGTELMDRAEAALRERGVSTVELEVFEANQAAKAFYRDRSYHVHRHRLAKDLEEE